MRGVVAVGPSSGEEASAIWNSIEQERPTLDQTLRRAIEDPDVEPEPGSLADRIRTFSVPLDPAGSVLARAATAASGTFNIHEYHADQGPDPFADAFGSPTFVVIPSMLTSPDGVRRLLERIEIHSLSNPDPALRFALLTDWADAESGVMVSGAGT